MLPLTQQAHRFVGEVVRPGDVAIDATAGNGHDTLFLAQATGPGGRVWSLDIQEQALAATRALLDSNGVTHAAVVQRGHEDLPAVVPAEDHGRIAAVMFNLGYLPGGDRQVTTLPASTLAAIGHALELIRVGGIVTIVAYAGHAGGDEELEAVRGFLTELNPGRFRFTEQAGAAGQRSSPVLFAIRREA